MTVRASKSGSSARRRSLRRHPEWRAALRTQLAARYCKTHRHGVYVVATAARDPDEIRAALDEEAASVGRELGFTIHPVVKDVPPERAELAKKPTRPRARSKAPRAEPAKRGLRR